MKISPHITLALISLSFLCYLVAPLSSVEFRKKLSYCLFLLKRVFMLMAMQLGITPMEMSLPRKVVHEIRLEKYGFNSAVKYFAPVPNDKAHNFVRFGLMEDFGYYVDLEPGTMKAKLKSELVPTSTGADPFERMAQQASKRIAD